MIYTSVSDESYIKAIVRISGHQGPGSSVVKDFYEAGHVAAVSPHPHVGSQPIKNPAALCIGQINGLARVDFLTVAAN